MSTLFIIGNGFDLNCGMKTSYKDVYREYVQIKNSSNVIKQFKSNIRNDIENWSDFELAMAEYAKQLDCEDEFIECVNDFSDFLINHLRIEEKAFLEKIKDSYVSSAVSNEMKKSLEDFYKNITGNIDRIMKSRNASSLSGMNVVSFNYTQVFDVIFYNLCQAYSIHPDLVTHIHGRFDDPILGMDNEEQINTTFELSKSFKRYFIKPYFNQAYDDSRVRSTENKISNARTICVFGMSLGESDLTWRDKLIEWLKETKNNHLFIYNYEYSRMTYKTIPQRMDIEDEGKTQLLRKWKVDDIDSIFNQLHLICGKNIFNIQNVIEEAVKKKNVREKGY